jgi:tetratricopeptide (TPR) repeat protein
VSWRADYAKAREEAAEKGRLLVIDLGTEECVWCKQLDQLTFREPGLVALLNDRCIPLKIDGQKNQVLVQALRIQKYPTIVFAAPDGRILGYQEGFIEAPALREQLLRAIAVALTPEWMLRDYQDAVAARDKGDHARALSLLRNLVEDGKDRPVQAKARQLVRELEQQAADSLVRIRQFADRGKTAEAIEAVNQVINAYPGTPAAREGSQLLLTLTSRSDPEDPQRMRRARDLLEQAREDYRLQQFHCCMDRCEVLTTTYADLPEATEAVRLLADIKGNEEWMKQATEQLADRMGVLHLSLADTSLRKGQPQQAVYYLERLVQAFPHSRHAETARERLTQIVGPRTEETEKK